MPGTSFQIMDVLPAEDVDGDEGPAPAMAGNELPLRSVLHDDLPAPAIFIPDYVIEANVLHELVEGIVVVSDLASVRGGVIVPFQNPERSLRFDGELIDIDDGLAARLLLDDPEDIPVKAGRLDAYHVRISLPEVAAQDE